MVVAMVRCCALLSTSLLEALVKPFSGDAVLLQIRQAANLSPREGALWWQTLMSDKKISLLTALPFSAVNLQLFPRVLEKLILTSQVSATTHHAWWEHWIVEGAT